ncbi:MAG TPA: GNAT family N-acetyltransferase [Micromonospora sp.]|nr:GNAT family N-acetyltransferase [Micromonospora sp.]
MPELIPPTERVRASFLAAMAEFRSEGRGDRQDQTMIGAEIRNHGPTWATPDGFARFVAELRGQALEETPRPEHWVPSTTLWWVDGDEYLGRIAIRHRLTPSLLDVGGHIGFDVRPAARRRGHATAMLAAALPVARGLGIDPTLVTCDEENFASRRVIERNGGVLEDKRQGKLRFWVPTGTGARPFAAAPIRTVAGRDE